MSLCTRSQVKLRLGIGDAETGYDSVIDQLRDGVSAVMAGPAGAGRELEQTDLVEVYSIDDPVAWAIWLRCWPVVAVSEVLERWDAADLWADLTALTADTDYQVDAASGLLLRVGVRWPRGLQSVRVTYEAGYVTPDTQAGAGWELGDGETIMPADLVEAAIAQCVHAFNRRKDPAAASAGVAGGNVSLGGVEAAGLLPGVIEVCRRYRRLIG
jgi:hypothetical protein